VEDGGLWVVVGGGWSGGGGCWVSEEGGETFVDVLSAQSSRPGPTCLAHCTRPKLLRKGRNGHGPL